MQFFLSPFPVKYIIGTYLIFIKIQRVICLVVKHTYANITYEKISLCKLLRSPHLTNSYIYSKFIFINIQIPKLLANNKLHFSMKSLWQEMCVEKNFFLYAKYIQIPSANSS